MKLQIAFGSINRLIFLINVKGCWYFQRNPTKSGALCRGEAGPVEVAPGGVTRFIGELDDGEHVEESLRPFPALRTGLLGLVMASDPGEAQEDKNN